VIDALRDAPERRTCSRAGCRRDATTAIVWRNPRIHTGDRHKTWLACDEHVDVLRDFLAARAFPLEVLPLPAASDRVR
jgi:hypothetical protein